MSALKSVEIPKARFGLEPSTLRQALSERVVVVDGAMGTMIQSANPTLADFEGHEGCNEVLNRSRPDLIAQIHRAYFAAGVDAVETNTFGANLANLAEYGIESEIYELSVAGAKVAREVADDFSRDGRPRWVFGSIGPGTKLPTLGHIKYSTLKQAYFDNARGLIDGGADAIIIETAQDLLQIKAAINGARQAIKDSQRDVVLVAQITVEMTGTMLLGSETLAALSTIESLDVDLIGMNCATGPAEMSEHLRQLSQSTDLPLSCMPNAGLPILTSEGPRYDLGPDELASSLKTFAQDYGVRVVGGCCGTTPTHLEKVSSRGRSKFALPVCAVSSGKHISLDWRAQQRKWLESLS
jgi:5-methyltetrahydrofolate--homocysteine methyltransferase